MEPKEDDLRELSRNILVAATSLIPGAGGVLSFFIDKYLPSTIEKRRDEFLKKLSVDFDNLPETTIARIANDTHYHTMLLKVFRAVAQEDQVVKINAYRNILINAASNDNYSAREEELYVRLLMELTSDQMKVLHYFYRRDYLMNLEFENINTYIQKNWTDVDYAYRFALVTELIRDGLITSSQKSQANGHKGHNLSALGIRFIEYIFRPNETTL